MININRIADAVCRLLKIPSEKVRIATLARALVDIRGNVKTFADAQPVNAKLTTYVNTKRYLALITQVGTSEPTVVELENTLGETPFYVYNGPGNYVCQVSSPIFLANKTAARLTGVNTYYSYGAVRVANNAVSLGVTDPDYVSMNDALAGDLLEIIVAP